jgi:hypothetical protein
MTDFFGGHTGWLLGYVIGLVVVLVVVALVVPILLLAGRIGGQAKRINTGLQAAETNTAGLKKLRITIESATNIVAGLNRGRTKLGG